MSFTINTNIAAMNAHANATLNNKALDSSLSKLSSGLRINSAADDASGLAIADSLRSQGSSLGQAIANANDGISIAQIADGAMSEQTSILDTIKTKATQAAQDGQSSDSRKALQSDISKLMSELDNIASTTAYNGKNLLSGQFTNQNFQVGAYSNQSVGMSIGATSSDKIGQTRFETTDMITGTGTSTLTFSAASGTDITLESVKISTSAGTGIGALADVINKNSNLTGVTASWSLTETGNGAVTSGTISNLTINGVTIAASLDVQNNDSSGTLVNAINQYSDQTGVAASTDSKGQLELTSTDGRAIKVTGLKDTTGIADNTYAGRLTIQRQGAGDIGVKDAGSLVDTSKNQASLSLRDMMGTISNTKAKAMGAFANTNVIGASDDLAAGVDTYAGAQAMMLIAQSASTDLDKIRSSIGSVQNQLSATVDNITVTQVNVAAAESQIRDVDFASESANFSKYNILSQSGAYAMSQANSVQQNVLKLLQ